MVPMANRDLPSPSLQYYYSGTTWTMNIVYQLREKGSRNFDDIYEELKWIEVRV
jgi:DNA-binding HxlR family transcriptional regulator